MLDTAYFCKLITIWNGFYNMNVMNLFASSSLFDVHSEVNRMRWQIDLI